MFPNLMFESGFIGVEYIVTFTVAGWAELWSPVAICVAPVYFIGNLDTFSATTPLSQVTRPSAGLAYDLRGSPG